LPQRDVAEFHLALDVPIGDTPAISRGALRAELIKEEAQEVERAIADNDLAGVIKELCDVLYVTYGAGLEFGVDLGDFWPEVHRSNMAKKDGPVRADGKRLKPPGWKEPDIESILRRVEKDQ
jgi:predicted HAD superfamily Cof-like phosphohydrolase